MTDGRRCRSKEATAARGSNRGGPRADPELAVDAGQVGVDGAAANEEKLGDRRSERPSAISRNTSSSRGVRSWSMSGPAGGVAAGVVFIAVRRARASAMAASSARAWPGRPCRGEDLFPERGAGGGLCSLEGRTPRLGEGHPQRNGLGFSRAEQASSRVRPAPFAREDRGGGQSLRGPRAVLLQSKYVGQRGRRFGHSPRVRSRSGQGN